MAEEYTNTGKGSTGVNPFGKNANQTNGQADASLYGGYGSGGSSGPTAEQQKAADNLGALYPYNQQTTLGKAANAGKNYDRAQEQTTNQADSLIRQALRNAGNDWYTQLQKQQSMVDTLKDSASPMFYGSGLDDFADNVARIYDMGAVETLNTARQNTESVRKDMDQALFAINNDRNDLAMDTEAALREGFADYAAQLNNIHPDLAADIFDTENRTLNAPDWLQTAYYDENARQALQPTWTDLYRPANTANDARAQGLSGNGDAQHNTESAANKTYWESRRKGYNRRTQ